MTRIMLVEDDKSLREIYGVRLLAEGYEIISAGDGEEAFAMAVKEHPDLILSDVMMPKISGFDMLDILRATPETKEIKVIMMTALSSEDQRARGEALGANRYLVKSQVGIEDVVRTVHDVLADVPAAEAPVSQVFNSPTPAPQSKPQVLNAPVQTRPNIQTPIIATEPSQNPIPETQPIMPTQNITMPQPTAPFSSPAPASLGNQITNSTQQTIPAPNPIAEPSPSAAPVQPQQPAPYATPYSVPIQQSAQQPPAMPIQDVIAPTQTNSNMQTPDMAALMEKELNNNQPASQNPGQNF